MPTDQPATAVTEKAAYRSFAVYSGRYSEAGRAAVYDNANMGTPLIEDAPWFFLDLVAGGIVSTSNVSVYVRIYDDGHATYLGPADRFRAMPVCAGNRWNDHARQYGLPLIRRELRAVFDSQPATSTTGHLDVGT